MNELKRKGFSLSELLIALTVVGVLFVVMITTVRIKAVNVSMMKLKSAYRTLENTVSYLMNNSNYYPTEEGFADSTSISGAEGVNKFCYLFKENLNLAEDYGCPSSSSSAIKKFARTKDNIVWYIIPNGGFTRDDSAYATKIVVDVNGESKPNCMSDSNCSSYKPENHTCNCSDPDTFVFSIKYNGKIRAGNSSSLQNSTDITDEIVLKYLEEKASRSY